jgi:hypothetical protein
MEESKDVRKRNHHHNYHTNQQLFFPKIKKIQTNHESKTCDGASKISP